MAWTSGGGGPSLDTVEHVYPEHWEPVQLLTEPNRMFLSIIIGRLIGRLSVVIGDTPPPAVNTNDSWLLPIP